MIISPKYINLFFGAILWINAGCGGGDPKIYINIPASGTNPFDGLLNNFGTSALYFRFIELNDNPSSMCDVRGTKPIWYPYPYDKGLSPANRSFSINKSVLEQGKQYRIELYGRNAYTSFDPVSEDPSYIPDYYGYPDCPFRIGENPSKRVNICFGDSADDPVCPPAVPKYPGKLSPVCAGMLAFSDCE